jgi:hypothetical protein
MGDHMLLSAGAVLGLLTVAIVAAAQRLGAVHAGHLWMSEQWLAEHRASQAP